MFAFKTRFALLSLGMAFLASFLLPADQVLADEVDDAYADWVATYADWTLADVEDAGYIKDTECVSAAAAGAPAELGAMGFHAVHPEHVADGVADAEKPDAIMLDEEDRVVGIEFIIDEVVDPAPEVGGMPLNVTAPHPGMEHEHMTLHVYFVGDEDHRYVDWNPAVTCPKMEPETGADSGEAEAEAHSPHAMPTTGIAELPGGASGLLLLAASMLMGLAFFGRWLEGR
jgi:hypothetical protein